MLRILAAALLAALTPAGAPVGAPDASPTSAETRSRRTAAALDGADAAAPARADAPAGERGAAAAAPVASPVPPRAAAAPVAGAPRATERAEGRLEAQDARVEVLAKPIRAGDTIELPEGYLRVEEDGAEDGEVGSFSIVPARTLKPETAARASSRGAPAAPAAPTEVAAGADVRAALDAAARPCRDERAAYLRELWKESGIEVADPDAVIAGLESGGGPASGFYWFALATDPFRPLAWSSSLRARADALARCVRAR